MLQSLATHNRDAARSDVTGGPPPFIPFAQRCRGDKTSHHGVLMFIFGVEVTLLKITPQSTRLKPFLLCWALDLLTRIEFCAVCMLIDAFLIMYYLNLQPYGAIQIQLLLLIVLLYFKIGIQCRSTFQTEVDKYGS